MSWCASCGVALSGTAALCRHHAVVYGQDWAVANRIICDLIHRGSFPQRLSEAERADDAWWREEVARCAGSRC